MALNKRVEDPLLAEEYCGLGIVLKRLADFMENPVMLKNKVLSTLSCRLLRPDSGGAG